MRGQGAYAELIGRRFKSACARLGLNRRALPQRTDLFRPPPNDRQMTLL
jgi:hypothetical protein